jgi:hypothetical protein
MNRTKLILTLSATGVFLFTLCTKKSSTPDNINVLSPNAEVVQTSNLLTYGGYASLEEYGAHLVTITGCHDCHTPKKIGPHGPELDMDLAFSGHPAGMPAPDVNRQELESKGIVATQTLTAWVGPWGISYAANLTSDATGIGNWTEEHFFRALRDGKFKGLPEGRQLLPPMPWEVFRHMSDEEVKAIFAYLKSTKPIKNRVPAPKPPVSAGQ